MSLPYSQINEQVFSEVYFTINCHMRGFTFWNFDDNFSMQIICSPFVTSSHTNVYLCLFLFDSNNSHLKYYDNNKILFGKDHKNTSTDYRDIHFIACLCIVGQEFFRDCISYIVYYLQVLHHEAQLCRKCIICTIKVLTMGQKFKAHQCQVRCFFKI